MAQEEQRFVFVCVVLVMYLLVLIPSPGVSVRDWHLFFGCRRRAEDYLYQEELEAALSDGILSELHLAFSRDQKQKIYVQQRLKEAAETVHDLIHNKKAVIFVCG